VAESKRRNPKNTHNLMKKRKRAAKPNRLLFGPASQEMEVLQKPRTEIPIYCSLLF
jgi:hypothetical protein